MKTNNKAIQEQTAYSTSNTQEEPLEYFINSQSFGFKFNYLESQDPNYAENIVEELNNKEDKS